MGLPTLQDVFPAVMESEKIDNGIHHDKVSEGLQILYPNFKEGASLPNFERFLSLVVAAEDVDKSFKDIRSSALQLLTNLLDTRSSDGEGSPLLRDFTKNLREGDVIITFNWDILIERSLWNQKKQFTFMELDSDKISVFKLHGSLNWALIPEGVTLKEPGSVVWMLEGKVAHTKNYIYYNLWTVLNEPPYIVPPISTKQPTGESFLKPIWYKASQAIKETHQISIIGYSLPENDIHARALLSTSIYSHKSLDKNFSYTLIDPDQDVNSRFIDATGLKSNFIQSKFNEEVLKKLFHK